ncbi:uncharacterized protein [Palaemon carinicauda]|uniref:uncharacterized protein n=1 Tax=Palaemon carinicauda TaxID=392227 RepID=UPI0035B60B8A
MPLQSAPYDLALHISTPKDSYAHFPISYPQASRPDIHQGATNQEKHCIYYHIKTTGLPVFARFRRLAPYHLAAAKQTFAEMEDMGLCQKASSTWPPPLHIILKKDGSLHMCGLQASEHEYRTKSLNPPKHCQRDLLLAQSEGFFLTLTPEWVLSGAHEPRNIPKTSITTTFEQQLCHLCIVPNHLQLRYDKCTFAANEESLLGHRNTPEGVQPLPEKIEAVQNFPKSMTVKALQELLGMINYYHCFLPTIGTTLDPFTPPSGVSQKT